MPPVCFPFPRENQHARSSWLAAQPPTTPAAWQHSTAQHRSHHRSQHITACFAERNGSTHTPPTAGVTIHPGAHKRTAAVVGRTRALPQRLSGTPQSATCKGRRRTAAHACFCCRLGWLSSHPCPPASQLQRRMRRLSGHPSASAQAPASCIRQATRPPAAALLSCKPSPSPRGDCPTAAFLGRALESCHHIAVETDSTMPGATDDSTHRQGCRSRRSKPVPCGRSQHGGRKVRECGPPAAHLVQPHSPEECCRGRVHRAHRLPHELRQACTQAPPYARKPNRGSEQQLHTTQPEYRNQGSAKPSCIPLRDMLGAKTNWSDHAAHTITAGSEAQRPSPATRSKPQQCKPQRGHNWGCQKHACCCLCSACATAGLRYTSNPEPWQRCRCGDIEATISGVRKVQIERTALGEGCPARLFEGGTAHASANGLCKHTWLRMLLLASTCDCQRSCTPNWHALATHPCQTPQLAAASSVHCWCPLCTPTT